jgi:peptidyl-prolyl cis-trans isomerase SurA
MLFVITNSKSKRLKTLVWTRLTSFYQEYEVFKEDLTQPFLIKNSLQEGELMKAYNRMKEVVKASHILLQFPPNASQADTISVLRMAQKLKADAETEQTSTNWRSNILMIHLQGTIKEAWVISLHLQMVSPFEDAAYGLK